MKEGLEKQVIKSMFNTHFSHKIFLFIIISLSISFKAKSQVNEYIKGKKYIIDSIVVSGLKTFNDKTVISYSGLRKGQLIQIPGEEISSTINKLWKPHN